MKTGTKYLLLLHDASKYEGTYVRCSQMHGIYWMEFLDGALVNPAYVISVVESS